ncbi:MAG: TonB-dependent receptor [Synergistaceae bacterium]|jgi:outer membrane cobalamin receptor|nr:TonB-dependent receptor [Synergistaceae bacterium]
MNPKGARKFAALLAALLLSAPPAPAAVDLPEELVVGVGELGEEEDRYLSPGAVTVVRPEDYAGEQRTLPDLLEDVPGLRVIRLQGRHGYSVASIRGSTSSQVAVYVDGVPVNLQSEAAVDLSSIPSDSVERVEVYRGYIPSRFGAQAMGGVINIVTKHPSEPETFVSLGTGSFGRYKGTVSRSMPLGDGKLFGSFGYESYEGDFTYHNDNDTQDDPSDDYEGRRENNGFRNADALLKWSDGRWSAKASYVRRDRELALTASGLDRPLGYKPQRPELDTSRWDVSLGRSQSSGSVEWGWEASYTGQSKKYDSGTEGGGNSMIGKENISRSEYDTKRIGISANAAWSMGSRHFMELRAGYWNEKLDVDSDEPFTQLGGIESYSRDDVDATLQDTIALDGAGTFLATPSLRWHKMGGESRLTWQVALSKDLPRGWMLKGTYGTYSRAPNTYEQYGDGAFILPAADDLKWEDGTQFDLGVSWSGVLASLGGARSNVSLTAFRRESENLIEFDMESNRFARYRNVAEATAEGAELELGLDWRRWALTFSGTWMDAEGWTPDPDATRHGGKPLPNRPDLSWMARLTRKISGRGGTEMGSLFAEYRHIDENYQNYSANYMFGARDVLNLGLKWKLSGSAQLALGVDDVLNDADDWRMYPPPGFNGPTRILWYPVEGRTYYMTLDMRF